MKSHLESLKKAGLYRQLKTLESPNDSVIKINGRKFVNFSSNNYLGLAQHPSVIKKSVEAAKKWGTGSGASRLISGSLGIHENLEKKIAVFKKEQASLLFSSGYLANIGALTAFLSEKDVVIVDRLSHASLIDAARLSKAKLWVYPHNDLTALKEILKRSKKFEKRLMVTDAYFSMDGDIAPLPELISLCREFDARLMIDEAHSMGVYGKTGAGLTEHFGVQSQVDIVMGTLSKALGSVGGYIAGSLLLKDFLINQSRAFIYTTAPSPMASAAALESLSVIQKNPSLRSSLWSNVRFMREGLESLGFNLMGSEGPIVPILIGDSAKAVQAKLFLEKEGFFVSSIRPPTVSAKTDRLRVSLMSTHKKEELEAFLKALKKLKEKLSL